MTSIDRMSVERLAEYISPDVRRVMLAQADRIEELEAKLANAEVIIRIIASDKWDERLGEAVDLSCEYLAELKGQKP